MGRKHGRSARLEVWSEGLNLVTIESIDGVGILNSDPLAMQARAEYSLTPTANRCQVSVMNLGKRTRATLAAISKVRTSASETQRLAVASGGGGTQVLDNILGVAHIKLFAGYGNDLQQVFEGSPSRLAHTRPDNTTWRTDIDCGDSAARLKEAVVSRSWGEGTPVLTTIVDVARVAGLSVYPDTQARLARWLGNAVHEYGYTATGDALSVLNELLTWSLYLADDAVLERIGATHEDEVRWTHIGGQLMVYGPSDVLAGPPVVLTPETGLVGRPREREGGVFEVTSLMEPRMIPGVAVSVTSRDLVGLFRCERSMFSVSTTAEGEHTVVGELHPIKAVGL